MNINTILYLLLLSNLVAFIIIIFQYIIIKNKDKTLNNINSKYIYDLNKIKNEIIKIEEDNNSQWIESEKETLKVLNGVSNLLDLTDKIDNIERNKILKLLNDIIDKLNIILNKK